MLGQSKNVREAEIDAACELADFLRFNTITCGRYTRISPIPLSTSECIEYRPLEGFVLAITPFNFTSIGGNCQSPGDGGQHSDLEAIE